MDPAIEYIFSINTGRSGSDYLANIFRHVADCCSFHEPQPICNGREMRLFLKGIASPMERLTHIKLAMIHRAKRSSRLYFESNHCFIKGYGWFLPKLIPQHKIGVIILKREKTKVAASLQRIGCSPLDRFGRDWICTPEMKSPLVSPPHSRISYRTARFMKELLSVARFCLPPSLRRKSSYPQWLSQYEWDTLCWYVDETFAQAEVYKSQYPEIRYYETTIEELNSLSSVHRMLTYFGYTGAALLKDVVGKPTNLKRACAGDSLGESLPKPLAEGPAHCHRSSGAEQP